MSRKRRNEEMNELKKSSPWVEYYRQVATLFKEDPAVNVAFDESTKKLTLRVQGEAKAKALEYLLPTEKTFGNVTLSIDIIPSNEEPTIGDYLRDAFSGNEALSFIHTNEGPVLTGLTYVVFSAEVAQYFSDNLMDINGNSSTLYEDLARSVFKDDFAGVSFCTDWTDVELRKPLGEWPC